MHFLNCALFAFFNAGIQQNILALIAIGQLTKVPFAVAEPLPLWQSCLTHLLRLLRPKPSCKEAEAQTSPDGTCGGRQNYNCLNSKWGSCCSKYGYCKSSSLYCGSGCQASFGRCSQKVSSQSPSASTSTVVPSLRVSPDGTCGGRHAYTCQGSRSGSCCSQYGYCGDSTAYCGKGCQNVFGTCTSVSSVSSVSKHSSTTSVHRSTSGTSKSTSRTSSSPLRSSTTSVTSSGRSSTSSQWPSSKAQSSSSGLQISSSPSYWTTTFSSSPWGGQSSSTSTTSSEGNKISPLSQSSLSSLSSLPSPSSSSSLLSSSSLSSSSSSSASSSSSLSTYSSLSSSPVTSTWSTSSISSSITTYTSLTSSSTTTQSSTSSASSPTASNSIVGTVSISTSCPNFYGYTSYKLMSLNTTNFSMSYGYYGTLDSTNIPTSVKYVGIWTQSTVNPYAPTMPDFLLDISTPGAIQAIYPNDTNIIMDSITETVTLNNCGTQLSYPRGNQSTVSKRDILPPRSTKLNPRQILKSAAITVQAYNECGSPDPAVPQIFCTDTTPGEGLLNDVPVLVTETQTVGPGLVQATCRFEPPDQNLGSALVFQGVVPALKAVCDFNDNWLNPSGAPLAGPSTADVCRQIVIAASVFQPEVLPFLGLCIIPDMINLYCQGQSAILPTIEDQLCGVTPSITRISVSVRDTNAGSGPIGNIATLGDIYSDDPSPRGNYEYHRPPPSGSVSCEPCSGKDASGVGTQTLSSPWEQVYAGDLFFSNSYFCDSFGYEGYIPAGGLGDAQAQCLSLAESGGFTTYVADDEKFYDDSGALVVESNGCWNFGCPISSVDFTLDLNGPKLSEQAIAFTREFKQIICY